MRIAKGAFGWLLVVASIESLMACGSSDRDSEDVDRDDALSTTASVCASVPEHATMKLSCPAGQTIQSIDFASYGTPTGVCGAFAATSCNASRSLSVVKQACVGKTSCSLVAGNNTFGDPCRGTFKHLDVQATCTASTPAPPTTDGGTGTTDGGTDSGTDAGSGTGLDSGDGGATTGTSCTGATAIYYVAANGSDSNSGTSLSAAWQTLSKVNATSFAAGNCVLFRAGDTFEGPLIPKTSGTSSAPITFGAYGSGAKPTISGFTDVSAWTSVGTNQWLSTRAVSTLSTLNMVTVNGAFAPIGRWPNTGYNKVDSHSSNTSLSSSSLSGNWTGAQVVIRKNHWILDKSTITSQSGTTINFADAGNYAPQDGWGFLIQNSQAACDTQNEWWYDASTKKVGIHSTSSPSGVKVATVDTLVDLGSKSYLKLDNLAFSGSNSKTVAIGGGSHITISSCDLSFSGIDALSVSTNSTGITLTNSTGHSTNNNFISGGGSQNWTITGNTIKNTAQVAGMGNSGDGNYIGMYNVGANSTIQYNTVTSTGYNGIDFRGPNITVANNVVDGFCNVKDDGAGIYTFTGGVPTVYAERYVTNNIVLNGGGASAGTNTTNSDAYGIYMDDNSSNVTISGNTVANCGSAGLFLHGNHDITASNNTFYNNVTTGSYGQVFVMEASNFQATRNIVFTENKVVSAQSSQVVAYFKTDANDLGSFGTFNNNDYCRPTNENSSTFSLIKSSGNQNTNLAGWQSFSGQDAKSQTSPKVVASTSSLRFEYNATNANKVISLVGNYVAVDGTAHSGSITLAPYSSVVLLSN